MVPRFAACRTTCLHINDTGVRWSTSAVGLPQQPAKLRPLRGMTERQSGALIWTGVLLSILSDSGESYGKDGTGASRLIH